VCLLSGDDMNHSANNIRRLRTPTPMSTPRLVFCSTTTDSRRRFTTLLLSVLAVVLDHLHSLFGTARWVCLLSVPSLSTFRVS
jgi:hypothetical protein